MQKFIVVVMLLLVVVPVFAFEVGPLSLQNHIRVMGSDSEQYDRRFEYRLRASVSQVPAWLVYDHRKDAGEGDAELFYNQYTAGYDVYKSPGKTSISILVQHQNYNNKDSVNRFGAELKF